MTTLRDRTDTDPIDTTAVTIRDEPAGVVSLAADIATIVDSFKQYQAAVEALLEDSDYQTFRQRNKATGEYEEKRFKKKSAWRKLAKAFGLTTQILDRGVDDDDCYWFIVRATDPRTGRSADGWGGCTADEKDFNKAQDVKATAQTRATNRAISDLIGAGEVSAEEMTDERTQHFGNETARIVAAAAEAEYAPRIQTVRETPPQRPREARQPAKAQPTTLGTPDTPQCSHGKPMVVRDGRNGKFWSAKHAPIGGTQDDPVWCRETADYNG